MTKRGLTIARDLSSTAKSPLLLLAFAVPLVFSKLPIGALYLGFS